MQCPYCREAVPEVQLSRRPIQPAAVHKIRRGLAYMLLAGLVFYFAGGYSAWNLPFQIPELVSKVLAPLLFVGGLGLSCYGLYTLRG